MQPNRALLVPSTAGALDETRRVAVPPVKTLPCMVNWEAFEMLSGGFITKHGFPTVVTKVQFTNPSQLWFDRTPRL